MRRAAPKPGIYPNVPYDVYASWPAVRASTLNQCAKSLAHGRESEINPKDDTAATAFGTAFHCAVLEPDRFRDTYVIAPTVDKRTNAGKEEWVLFKASLKPHQEIITESEYLIAEQMINGVYACRDAAVLLSHISHRELCVVWKDDETGLLCKARIDAITQFAGWTFILDLKSARDASQHAFRSHMTTLGYYRSMAWYRHGLNVLSEHARRCVLLACEKVAPFCAVPYQLTESALEIGMTEMRALLRDYAKAQESGIFPGYSDDIVMIDVAGWKEREYENV